MVGGQSAAATSDTCARRTSSGPAVPEVRGPQMPRSPARSARAADGRRAMATRRRAARSAQP
eukprot:8643134-Lingulodinium_polyedra.AAC.1